MWSHDFIVVEDPVTMHFSFEPKTFIECLIKHVNEFSLATQESFDKLALINDIATSKT